MEIRKVSLGLLPDNNCILVEKFNDRIEKKIFYKLIGGKIEKGESPSKTLKREFIEETGKEIEIIRKLCKFRETVSYKNIKRIIDSTIYLIRFKNKDDYNFKQIKNQNTSIITWKNIKFLLKESTILYPTVAKHLIKKLFF